MRLGVWGHLGRALRVLDIVDNGIYEAVTVHPECAIGGDHLDSVLERISESHGQLTRWTARIQPKNVEERTR